MRILIPIGALFLALPLGLAGYREGPLPNMTGGFGEPSCQSCHFGNALNAPGGKLALTGVPATYAAGREYAITVTLARAALARGGFEISSRFASGPQKGKQAGIWRAAAPRLQIIPSQSDPKLMFVQHTSAGSIAPSPGSNSWTMSWTAPAPASVAVQFNVAANATNDDASPLGDYIYLSEALARAR